MSKIVCGVDLGGTKINAGLVDCSGKIIRSIKVPTLGQEGPNAVIGRIKKVINDLLQAENISISDIDGIGVCSPGPTDSERGVVVCAPNLPGWDNVKIVDILKEEFNTRIKLENDANAAALGEHIFGSGRGVRNFVYMTVSTGIGGGVIIDNKLYTGSNSNAAEIGHHVIDINGPKCNCGNYGCIEAIASGTALARFATEALQRGENSIISEIASCDGGTVKSEHVFDAAKRGDRLAKELIDKEAFYLGIGICNILSFYNPERIAIGGGVASQWDMLYDKMIRVVKERGMKPLVEACEIVKAELGGDVGLLGAAALVF
jgi:glucokinase